MVNLFIMTTPLSGGPACWVESYGGSYEAARTMLEDLGTFDDIVWKGRANGLVRPTVAFMASESADIWAAPNVATAYAKRDCKSCAAPLDLCARVSLIGSASVC
eukprot:COSAG04_NODE_289_length_17842_cov_141.473483_8_plen_104_part_00